MHSKIIAVGLLASLALAKPIERRAMTTEYDIVTVWTTVTAGQEPAPTKAPERNEAPAAAAAPAVPAAEVPAPAPEQPAPEQPTPEQPAPGNFAEGSPAPADPQPAPQQAPEPAPAQSAPEPKAPAAEAPAQQAPAPQAPASSDSTPPSDGSYKSNILYHHNVHRSNHSADALTWSDELAAAALKLAQRCVFKHDTTVDHDIFPNGYGQNLGAGTDADGFPAQISGGMYNDEVGYYDNFYGMAQPPDISTGTYGHFTQIVWKGTKQVGCATFKCDSLAGVGGGVPPFNSVCNYSPPGNYQDQYAGNVGRPLGHAPVS